MSALHRMPSASVLPAWYLVVQADVEEERRGEPLVVSHKDVHAEISATIRSGLQPGEVKIALEGLGDDEHERLRTMAGTRGGAALDLYLGWLGTDDIGGYLANLIGMPSVLGPSEPPVDARVTRLAVTRVKRQRGSRDYETAIEAVDLAVHRLGRKAFCSEVGLTTLLGAASALATASDVEVRTWANRQRVASDAALPSGQAADDDTAEAPQLLRGRPHLDSFRPLECAMAEATGLGAPGMYLVRDGVLHVGVRAIPLEGEPIDVTEADGLIEVTVERGKAVKSDNLDLCGGNPPPREPDTFTLVCQGRPDVRPGDVVRFPSPSADTGALAGSVVPLFGNLAELPVLPSFGGLGDNPAHAHVDAVKHELGRTTGFTTTITAIRIDPDDPWHPRPPLPTDATCGEDPDTCGGDRLSRAVRRAASSLQRDVRPPDVAEVRAAHAESDGAARPAQTVKVWRGLVASDGRANQARRLEVERTHPTEIEGVAVATPFAWGPCGLVVPRYPFTRVLLNHRNGRGEDPVDVGALWGPGGRPEQAQAGDWWLHLPAAVPAAQRTGVDNAAVPDAYDGAATSDLIDADGRRVIEVGELTIRVNLDAGSNAPAAGTRPTVPGDEALTIEHTRAGSRIVLHNDGNITIEAAADLGLTAGGTVTITGDQVDVVVGNTMDVRKS